MSSEDRVDGVDVDAREGALEPGNMDLDAAEAEFAAAQAKLEAAQAKARLARARAAAAAKAEANPAAPAPAPAGPTPEPASAAPEAAPPAAAEPETAGPGTAQPETSGTTPEPAAAEAQLAAAEGNLDAAQADLDAAEAKLAAAGAKSEAVPATNAAEAPKTEAPKTEAPKTEAPKTEAPKTEAPKTEAPDSEAPETEAPKTEDSKPEPSKTAVVAGAAAAAVAATSASRSDGEPTAEKSAAGKSADVTPADAGPADKQPDADQAKADVDVEAGDKAAAAEPAVTPAAAEPAAATPAGPGAADTPPPPPAESEGAPAAVPPFKRRNVQILVAAVAVVVIAALVSGVLVWKHYHVPDDVAYRVYGNDVTIAQLNDSVQTDQALYGFTAPTDPVKRSQFNKDFAQANAVSDVIDHAAAERNIVVADRVVQDTLSRYITQVFGPGDDGHTKFVQQLANQGTSEGKVLTELKRQLTLSQLTQQVVAGVQVSDQEMQQYFAAHQPELGTPETRDLHNMVLADKATAQAVVDQIKAGANFEQLAQQQSLDTSTKDSGGDLGQVAAAQLEPAYAQVAFAAPVSGVYGPVQTTHGWNVGKVVSITPGAPAVYAQIKDQLRQFLIQKKQADKWRDFLTAQIKDAGVVYNPAYRPANPDALPSTEPQGPDGGAAAPGAADPGAAAPGAPAPGAVPGPGAPAPGVPAPAPAAPGAPAPPK